MIQTDTFLKIGKTHQECEDYIISGENPYKYVILSDGCSSSKQTEMGARILCHLAKQYLQYRNSDYRFPDLDYNEMGQWIIHNAELTARQLGLRQNCLDATLIVAYEHENRVYIYMYGDGAIIVKNKNGTIALMEVEYTENAPFYLSYRINPEAMDLFHKMKQDLIIRTTFEHAAQHSYAYDYETKFSYDIDRFPRILICSDGISSFMKSTESEQTIEIAKEFLAYKSTKGEFLKRRLKRAIKVYESNEVCHNDDLSVGAFIDEVV